MTRASSRPRQGEVDLATINDGVEQDRFVNELPANTAAEGQSQRRTPC